MMWLGRVKPDLVAEASVWVPKMSQLVEGRLSPDAKAADVATGELQQADMADLAQLHTWDVGEGLGEALVLVVDHKGTLAHDEAAVAHLTLAGASFFEARRGQHPRRGRTLEHRDGVLGLLDCLGRS